MGRLLFKGGRTGFGWFKGGKDWFWLVSGWEGLVSAGFVREGLVSGGFGSFRFLVTTPCRLRKIQRKACTDHNLLASNSSEDEQIHT